MTRHSKGQYINGEWLATNNEPFSSTNPGDNTPVWQGSNAREQDVALAYQSARRAIEAWSALDETTRLEYALKFAEMVEKNRAQLSLLISLETGKPHWEAETEVNSVIAKVKISHQAFIERTANKETLTGDTRSALRFKPYGVAVVLGAFNFPAHLSNGHIVPALLAGNTILYKPSELAPAVAELIMECWHEAGIPPGVINCLQGDATTGRLLLDQPINGVYFTGSYATGLKIHQHFASRPEVIVALEMGGNNPLVVGSVKNLSAAVYHTLMSAFVTAGQRCTCARRLMIPRGEQGDKFLQLLLDATRSIKVGLYHEDPQPFIGPVISASQALKHLHSQDNLIHLGAKPLLPMQLLAENTGLLSPGILDMTQVASPPDEEIFAPLLQIYRYNHFAEAIALANQTRYGLAAGLLSDEESQYQRFYQEINAGLINWNKPTTGAASNLPFGGIGCSGNHRPSAYFAADYCAYPIASQEQSDLTLPATLSPGIKVN